MAKNISFKDFMDQVATCLKAYSREDLQGILMDWAKNTHPSKRNEFLSKLIPALPAEETSEPDEELLEEINALALRVENGDYCEGWGWDDDIQEERDFGDESWAGEADEYFDRAHEAMTAGHHKFAKEAYARLFDILDMGEESGHLPGSPDPQDLLDTNLGEARAGYLRSVYLSCSIQERTAELLQAVQRFRFHIGDELNLQSIVKVGCQPLPDFTQFLDEWIELLKHTDDRSASYLLREAVLLSGGIPAIARLARDEGNRYPRAYVDWIKALERDGDFHSMLEAAKEGLANVPKDYAVRAEIAEGMVRAGDHLQDTASQLAGWHEAFFSNPALSNLLSLLSVAEQKGCYREEIGEAITRIVSLLEMEGKAQSRFLSVNRELQESTASGNLLCQAYLLAGRYEDAFDLCKKKGALGWSYGQNPKGLVIPFLMQLLSKGKHLSPAENLESLWKESLDNMNEHHHNDHNIAIDFEKAMDKIIRSIQLSEEEQNTYLRWCIEETGSRVDAIVGEKHRQSYYKAATLLVALAEVLANRDRQSKGIETIEKYRQKYRHYSAFQKELKVAMQRSRLSV